MEGLATGARTEAFFCRRRSFAEAAVGFLPEYQTPPSCLIFFLFVAAKVWIMILSQPSIWLNWIVVKWILCCLLSTTAELLKLSLAFCQQPYPISCAGETAAICELADIWTYITLLTQWKIVKKPLSFHSHIWVNLTGPMSSTAVTKWPFKKSIF